MAEADGVNSQTGSASNSDSPQSIVVTGTVRDIVSIHQTPAPRRHLNARTIARRLSDIADPETVAEQLIELDPQVAAEALAALDLQQSVAVIPHVDAVVARAVTALDGDHGRVLAQAIEADAAIYECQRRHKRSLGNATGPLERVAAPAERPATAPGFRVVHQHGAIYWSLATSAQPLRWAIWDYYERQGGSAGRLGFPLTGEINIGGLNAVQRFQDKQDYGPAVAKKLGMRCGASVYWSKKTGAHSTWGGIGEHYELLGGAATRLGFPAEDEVAVGPSPAGTHGWQQRFSGGLILWSETTGGVAVYTSRPEDPEATPSMAHYFEESGGVTGPLGFPVGPRHDAAESPRGTKGTLQRFEGPWPYHEEITRNWNGEAGGAVVYRCWRGGAEPHCVRGGIGILHETEGGTGGRLGFPLTDEIRPRDNDDVYQVFEGGIVFWTLQNDAIAVPFDIDTSEDIDFVLTLGFPISASEQIGDSEDSVQFFEHGLQTVRDGVLQHWVAPRDE